MDTTTRNTPTARTMTRVGMATAAVLGVAAASALVARGAGSADRLGASVDDQSVRAADAIAAVETDIATGDVIRLDVTRSSGDDGDSGDENVDDEGGFDIVTTPVIDAISDLDTCIFDLLPDAVLPDAVTGSQSPTNNATHTDPCSFLPSGDDFGALDLGAIDVDTLDLADLDAASLDDLVDIDLGFDKVDFGGEVLDVASDIAGEVIDFVQELPDTVGDQLERWFGD